MTRRTSIYDLAWELQRNQHDPLCSITTTAGKMLCDCEVYKATTPLTEQERRHRELTATLAKQAVRKWK